VQTWQLRRREDLHYVLDHLHELVGKEGSLVVNSSQGGGTKDNWVLER